MAYVYVPPRDNIQMPPAHQVLAGRDDNAVGSPKGNCVDAAGPQTLWAALDGKNDGWLIAKLSWYHSAALLYLEFVI